jgi:hypothetical protein
LPNGGGVGAQAAGRYRFARPVSAVFERDDEHEPTDDGRPARKGERLSYSILWDGRDAKLVCGEKPVSSGDKTPGPSNETRIC